MFVKILVPNRNNKIELSVQELEALIEEAIRKDRLERPYYYNTGWTTLNNCNNTMNSISSINGVKCTTGSLTADDTISISLDDLTTATNTTNGVKTI